MAPVLIERKSVQDVAGSLADGRWVCIFLRRFRGAPTANAGGRIEPDGGVGKVSARRVPRVPFRIGAPRPSAFARAYRHL